VNIYVTYSTWCILPSFEEVNLLDGQSGERACSMLMLMLGTVYWYGV
jgi:hypothetical protein